MYTLNTRPDPTTGISPYQIMFGAKSRSLHNVTPYLEYDHFQMQRARQTIHSKVLQHHRKLLQQRSLEPPAPLEIGTSVKVVKPTQYRSKTQYTATGPYTVVKKIGSSTYQLQHDLTKELITVPRQWIQPFRMRSTFPEGGSQRVNTEPSDSQLRKTDEEEAQKNDTEMVINEEEEKRMKP